MRTSNKILLALFFTTILLFTGLFAAVRIKYANGAIIKRDTEEMAISRWSNVFPVKGAIRAVSIIGLNDVMIVPADSARIEIAKEANKLISWRFENGILTIMADTTVQNQAEGSHSVYGHVELFLAGIDSIYARNSNVQLKNTGDSTVNPSYNFTIDKSVLSIHADNRQHDGAFTNYNKLQIDASAGSEIKLGQLVAVNELSVGLQKSRLEEEDGPVRFGSNLKLRVDDASSIKLSGQNLRKAIISSKE